MIEDINDARQSSTTNYIEPNMSDTVIRPIDNFDIKVERDLHEIFWENYGEDVIYLIAEVYGETAPNQGRKRVSWT